MHESVDLVDTIRLMILSKFVLAMLVFLEFWPSEAVMLLLWI